MTLSNGVRETLLAVAAALTVLGLLAFDNSSLLRGLETSSLDLRFRLRGTVPPGSEVAVVMVDDRSIDTLGHWPLSHRLFSQALQILDRDRARTIVFDLLFAQPEQPIPPDLQNAARTAAAALPADSDAALRGALKALAEDDPDRELARAIKASGNVYLPIAFAFTGKKMAAPDFVSDAGYQRFVKSPVPPDFPLKPVSAVTPLPIWATEAAGLGHVNIAFDRDGAPRYDYLALPFEGDFLPSLPVRAAAAYLGVKWPDVGLALGEGVRLGPIAIPTDPAARLLINYRGPRGTFPTYSFVDLLDGHVPPTAFDGKIVLIGASFLGLPDSSASPYGSTPLPGTERMAGIIDQILHRDFIAESPPGWPIAVAVAVALLAGLAGVGAALLPTRLAALSAGLPLLIWAGATQAAFLHGLWLPLVKPETALAVASVAVLLFRYRVVDYEGRVIKTAFRRYLAPDMVNYLSRHPERLKLGGETRNMTMLFCDVRGFTAISEQYKANPHELTHLINRFLTPMTDLILARRGTIDKYIGDCIMAFWNAPLDDPDHATHACASALAMIAALEGVNAELASGAAAQGRAFTPLRVGIGINTGDCVVGNVGSDQRFDYSVLGDAVNLAARLEPQSKNYDVSIVVGEATREQAPAFAAIELDRIAVYGRHEAVRIYTLLGDEAAAASAGFIALAERHDAMLGAYRAQDWDAAETRLIACRNRDQRLDALYELYAERIAYFRLNPPGPDWNGVFVATSK
ncbi:MAG TPA: adenylate/guanylate cyclase domain-containing protein [Stellaceae bacterium]|nr:adenylate/guanylate cyclase domain-containing protein [Stellaceae bacterium]